MKKRRIFFVFIFLLLHTVVYSSEVKEFILENGLKIIIIEEHKAPVATFQVWYRTGSRDEPIGKSGLSHLLEHMMFKGTQKYGPSEFSKIIQKNGGIDNAYTTKDHTVYFELLPSDRILLPVELETDRMQNLIIDNRETLLERDVVMEERRLRYEDDPQNSLFEEVVAVSFKAHPYQRPVIGWMSDLKSIGRDDLYNYYKSHYSPDNAFIIVDGDVRTDEIIEKIKNYFGRVSPSGIKKKNTNFSEPEQKCERRVILKREAELPYILIAYHTPNFPHDDSFALDVLSLILAGGKSSRLYKSIVYEKQIALDIDAEYDGLNIDPFLFFVDATAAPGKEINDVEKTIFSEIENIKKIPPSEQEVQKAKNQIESSFIMEQDSIYMEAMKYGIFEMLGDWRLINRYLEGIRNVTPEDIKRVANRYLREDNRTVGILIPIKKVRSEY
ncbi:MAG: insulinase family protein [Nitrospirae bacterium]|nr:insulinase family protein [Nitrospirota bacterium]